MIGRASATSYVFHRAASKHNERCSNEDSRDWLRRLSSLTQYYRQEAAQVHVRPFHKLNSISIALPQTVISPATSCKTVLSVHSFYSSSIMSPSYLQIKVVLVSCIR
jgi:hypothetical protein